MVRTWPPGRHRTRRDATRDVGGRTGDCRREVSHRAVTVRHHPADAEGLGDVPAVVLGRRSDVLAWNRSGHALFAGHLDPDAPQRAGGRPNMARLVFLDHHTRGLYVDWPSKARAVVGNLRLVAGQHPQDSALHALVGELGSNSTEFASMWADHRVKPCTVAAYEMRHPLVGALTVIQQTLSHGSGPVVVVATTETGSPSRAALTLLAQATAPSTTRPTSPDPLRGSAQPRSQMLTD
ncbi:MmyB family transcriptional regulator [Streptomyces sp. NPDC055506]